MSGRDASPPAFPVHPGLPNYGPRNGMTLRDYFAAQALPAVIKHYAEVNGGIGVDHLLRNCPIIAYQIADAMLARRQGDGSP